MTYSHSRQIEELNRRRPDSYLWYNTPASTWYEALPLGNGSIGAMVYGGVSSERYQLNHDTLYSDEPGRRDLDLDVTKELDRVIELISRRKYAEADDIVTRKWLGRSWPCYQPMADLELVFPEGIQISEYFRCLDLQRAVHTVSYHDGTNRVTRESLLSYPDNVLAIRLTADGSDRLACSVRLSSVHPTSKIRTEDGVLILSGKAPGLALRRALDLIERREEQWKYPEIWGVTGTRKANANEVLYGEDIEDLGMNFEVRVAVACEDASISGEDGELRIADASEATMLLTAVTSYNGFDKSPSAEGVDPGSACAAALSTIGRKSYDAIKCNHIDDYGNLYDRVSLDLPSNPESSELPTDKRIENAMDDPSYIALYYQFARYMTIAGSRPGTQPLNLQGIWNKDVVPPWASAYTININIQMNYWPVAGSNLIECEEPMNDLVRELSVSGERVARDMYGCDGWVAHHNTSLWRSAQPVDNVAQTTFWPMGSGWLCRHLWEHYQFTCDTDFLKNYALPLLRGASRFYLQWLVEDKNGWLVTPVGTSPENAFRYRDEDGETQQASVSSGPTVDMAIIRDCFLITARSLAVTGEDQKLAGELGQALENLYPYTVADDGQLKEWSHEEPGHDPRHRHLSHLYGAFPGDQIHRDNTPDLVAAVARTLEVRGEDSGGWSSAWKANLWARIGDGEKAHRNLMRVVQSSLTNPNLFNGHREWNDGGSLFQIDGNMGGASALLEMLVQSKYIPGEPAVIDILPALPAAWPEGRFTGVRCRGGFEISITWKNSELVDAEVISFSGNPLTLRYVDVSRELSMKPGERIRFDAQLA